MTPERDDLTVVEQRIRAAKEYIYKQERLIEQLADEAKNTDDAFVLLNILNRALRLFERHELLLDRLGLSRQKKSLSEPPIRPGTITSARRWRRRRALMKATVWTLAFGQREDRWPTCDYEPTREAAIKQLQVSTSSTLCLSHACRRSTGNNRSIEAASRSR